MKSYVLLFFLVFLLPFVHAGGCCFDTTTGLCSSNAQEESCSSGGAEFYSSSCSSVDKCGLGCCLIGNQVSFVTQRSCQLYASSAGFQLNWDVNIEESQCNALVGSDIEGACLIGDYRPFDCTFTTLEQCYLGNFQTGLTCTDPSLNTTCIKTDKGICFNDDAYSLDSCGNRDSLIEDCNYELGTKCYQEDNGRAYCKQLNCTDSNGIPRANGEKWCSNEVIVGYNEQGSQVPIPDDTTFTYTTTEGWTISFRARNTRDIFDNGVAINTLTQQRYEFDANQLIRHASVEQNLMGNVQCEGNHGDRITWQSPDGGGVTTYSDGWSPLIDRTFTGTYQHLGLPVPVTGAIQTVSTSVESYMGGGSAVGERALSEYCLDGEVYAEPCADFRNEICIQGKCENNPWQQCIAAGINAARCDTQHCFMFNATPQTPEAIIECNTETSTTTTSTTPVTDELVPYPNELSICLPKYKGGFQFYPSEDQTNFQTTSVGDICSKGDFTFEVKLGWHAVYDFWMIVIEDESETYRGAFFFDILKSRWSTTAVEDRLSPSPNNLLQHYNEDTSLTRFNGSESLDAFYKILEERCQAISDCGGSANWLGGRSTSIDFPEIKCKTTGDNTAKCTLTFKCATYSAPSNSNICEQCNEKLGDYCTEYSCKALGQNCKFNEDNQKCYSSNDRTPPLITHTIEPSGEIPPFSEVRITLTTDTDSKCKFNIGSSGSSYEDMPYTIDGDYALNHFLILYPPGQDINRSLLTSSDTSESSIFDLISNDGEYNVFVRCEDIAGNYNIAPHLITFNVMDTPDALPPLITNFTPISGSFVKFNTTEKKINFKINEPSECKWGHEDIEFNKMKNFFSCDNQVTLEGTINGYTCSGTLRNITLDLTSQTKFYIKCKDQPWLEGLEDNYYRRNENQVGNDYEYILRPSEELEILEITPTGIIKIGNINSTINLKAITSGGAISGKAKCSWRLLGSNYSSSFVEFLNTNSNVHTQTLTNRPAGTYTIQVKCIDEAENEVSKNSTFNLIIDKNSPSISRIYFNSNSLKIYTDEDCLCYSSFNNLDRCSFNIQEADTMSGVTIEHTVGWENSKTYYVKCVDQLGNENNGCMIIKT